MGFRSIVLALALFVGSAAHAHEGMIEINQAGALAGGINGSLASDPAGFPVRITASGSYVLTSDLVIASVNTDAIQIDGTNPLNVSIDLNGFAIRGPITCTGEGASLACSPSVGTGRAIYGTNNPNLADAVMVRNGRIVGMSSALYLNSRTSLVRDLIVMNSGYAGVGNGLLLDSIFTFNLGSQGPLTSGSISVGNTIVADTLVSSNRWDGIAGGVALLTRVTTRDNGGSGISNGGSGSILISNSSAVGNASVGIDCGGPSSCLLIDNTIAENASAQLDMTGCNGAYTNNVFYSGSGGPTGAACPSGGLPPNVCNGSLTCP